MNTAASSIEQLGNKAVTVLDGSFFRHDIPGAIPTGQDISNRLCIADSSGEFHRYVLDHYIEGDKPVTYARRIGCASLFAAARCTECPYSKTATAD